MFRHARTTMLRLSATCLVLTLAVTIAFGDGVTPVSTPTSAPDTLFLGDYVGTFHPVGEYGGKPRPEDSKDFKPQKCGTCHTEANIARTKDGFVLTMLIDHDEDGRPKKDRITLKGERHGDALTFGNGNYTIRAGGDEVTGNRTGRMAAEIKLRRKPASPGTNRPSNPRATVGAYYFDGWAGNSTRWKDDPAWTKLHPPTHLTKRMIEEFADREPIWGWRDDSLDIMERQIDLAADHGIAFFAFCWYWNKDRQKLETQPMHTGLHLFLKAKNNHRMKFCLLVANHQGFLFHGADEWKAAAQQWLPYLNHPQHVTVDGKPLVIVFNPRNGDTEGFAGVQAAARKAGLPGVAIAGCGGGQANIGFTHTTHYNIVPGYAGGSEPRKYGELVQAHQRAWRGSREQPYLPTLSVGWDKRPWEGDRGLGQAPGWYFPDRTPGQFATALESAVEWMDRHPEQTAAERIVLLYAWNEFGEGGYLAPTKGDPDGAYLKVIKRVVEGAKP